MKKINLVEALKAKGATLDDATEKTLNGVSEELNKQYESLQAGISKEDADKSIKEAIEKAIKDLPTGMAAKDVFVGEGDAKKSIEQVMREQGDALTKLQKGGGAAAKMQTLEGAIAEKWEDIQKVFKAKEGVVNITVKAAAIMTTANTIDVDNLDPALLGAEKIEYRGLVLDRRNREYIFDIADRRVVSDLPEVIRWDEEGDEEGAFAIVAEGAVKPLISLGTVRNESEKKKAAGKIVVTEELMKFRPRLMANIRTLFDRKVMRDFEGILTTSLIASAASYVGTTLDGTITDPNDYDAIGAVAAQLETLNFSPNVLIINPQDKWRMALTKDADGRYVTTLPITGANGQVQFMTFRTVTTNRVAAGTAILGEGDLWKIEHENMTMRIGYGVTMNGGNAESDFDHNRMRIIAELYFHEYIASIDNGSFVQFNFDTVKSALAA